MDSNRMWIVVLVVLATNVMTAIGTGIFCYNAGWQEAFDFTTTNYVQTITDMKKGG